MEAKETLKVGSHCVYVKRASPHPTAPDAFIEYGQICEVVAVFDSFYVVLSHEDLEYYHCGLDEVELYLGQI